MLLRVRVAFLAAASATAVGTPVLGQEVAYSQAQDALVLAQVKPDAAEEAVERTNRLEEVLVVARKRASSEELQKTPIAATAITAAQLDRAFVEDLTEVGRMAPSVSLQTATLRGTANFAIRGMGVSGTTPSDEPAVGIFQDGVYWGTNYGALNDLFDVESVEILRGPQGTLFGRNVTGGAVILRSARPTAEPSARAMIGAGSGGLYETSLVLNGPIAGETVSGRLALQGRTLDGYFKELNTGEDYGESESFIVRPSIKFQPTQDFDVTVLAELYSEKGDPVVVRGISPSTITPGSTIPERDGYVTPSDFWTASLDQLGFNDVEVSLGVVEANWKVLGGVLTSVTGYREVTTHVRTDGDGSPSPAFLQTLAQNQDQWSTELRFAADVSDFLSYTAGVYYFMQDFDYWERRDNANATTRLASRSFLENESYALFAEADFHFTDRLTGTLGVRHTEETKDVRSAPFGGCSLDHQSCTFAAASTSDQNTSPKLGLSFQLTDDQLVFASATRGFRSGGFGLRGTPLASPYDHETVTAYEIGYKGDLLEDRVRLNTAIYHNEYKDLQRTVLADDPVLGFIQNVFNAADATIDGAEIELTVVASDDLTLNATYGYTDGEFKRFLGVANPRERKFTRIPENMFSASALYERPLRSGANLSSRLSVSYTGEYFYDDPNLLKQGSYTLVDASVGYTDPSGRWTISLWGKNLGEEKYAYWGSSLGPLGQNAFPGAPRTWGVRLVGEF